MPFNSLSVGAPALVSNGSVMRASPLLRDPDRGPALGVWLRECPWWLRQRPRVD